MVTIQTDEVRWKDDPDTHDYPAAGSYLSLVADERTIKQILRELKRAEVVHFKAKDILRASGLPLLPADNLHVLKDLRRIMRGKRLSPVLLVRGQCQNGVPAQIADGYHRVCASYHVDENTDIPVKIAPLPEA
jgi:hypothetical protein